MRNENVPKGNNPLGIFFTAACHVSVTHLLPFPSTAVNSAQVVPAQEGGDVKPGPVCQTSKCQVVIPESSVWEQH